MNTNPILKVTLYTNLGDDGVIHGMNEISSNVLITSHSLLPKILNLKNKLVSLKTIIVFDDFTQEERVIYLKQSHITIVPFKHIERKGETLNLTITKPAAESIAMIMYTSGSTDEPKGGFPIENETKIHKLAYQLCIVSYRQ